MTPSPRTRIALLVAAIVIATVALYYPVSSHPFLNYDDDIYVLNNPQVQAGLTWETVKWSFTSLYASNWHPLTWLSHALDCQMFGLDAGRHHETNLLLHVINVMLLFWVLWKATGYAGRSAMVAALFALHPINVESVAWIAERKNLLSMMFFLLALGAYGWYARKPRVARVPGGRGFVCAGIDGQAAGDHACRLSCCFGITGRSSECLRQGRQTASRLIPAKPFSWLLLEKLPLLALAAAQRCHHGSRAIRVGRDEWPALAAVPPAD